MELREKIAEAIYGHSNEDHDDARLLADKVLAIPEIKTALELQEGARSASGHAR